MSSITRRFYTELCQTLFRHPSLVDAAEPLIQRQGRNRVVGKLLNL